jgi:predicted Fe-S protein YdhL (DUF1289 family)
MQAIKSPCTGNCKVDSTNSCTGCFRTLDEIRNWGKMSDTERELVIADLMARPPKEDTVEDHFVKEFKKAFPQGQIHKYEIRRSEPDRICLLPGGVTVFIELKRPGKELREEQERAARRLGDLGFDCYWANTKELVDKVVAEMVEKYGTQGGCTECGGAIMPLRSLNLKRCYGCGHETPWRLKENQKPLICAQR